MLSFGVLFFSLVAIMVPRAPQAVVGGDKGVLEEGRRSLSPGGTRCPAPAAEGQAKMRENRPGKLRLGEKGVPAASPAHCGRAKQSSCRAPPHTHPRWGGREGPSRGRGRPDLGVPGLGPLPASGRGRPGGKGGSRRPEKGCGPDPPPAGPSPGALALGGRSRRPRRAGAAAPRAQSAAPPPRGRRGTANSREERGGGPARPETPRPRRPMCGARGGGSLSPRVGGAARVRRRAGSPGVRWARARLPLLPPRGLGGLRGLGSP